MDRFNTIYVGMSLEEAREKMLQEGYQIEIERQEGKRDKDILTQEIVLQVLEEKKEKVLLVRTGMFKKYI